MLNTEAVMLAVELRENPAKMAAPAISSAMSSATWELVFISDRPATIIWPMPPVCWN